MFRGEAPFKGIVTIVFSLHGNVLRLTEEVLAAIGEACEPTRGFSVSAAPRDGGAPEINALVRQSSGDGCPAGAGIVRQLAQQIRGQ